MATSGTTTFDLDFTDIAEEAWERAGRVMRSGYDLQTARRSMNLMMLEWQNRGVNMWTVDSGTVSLTSGTATYNLPTDTIDLLDHVIRTGSGTSQSDITISRINVSTFSSIPNKNQTGRPIQLYINRLVDQPTVTVWPVPDNNDYTLAYWRMRRIQDAGAGVQTADMNARFLPVLVAGLAYHLSMKVPELAARSPMLQAEYESQWNMASSEDRDKAPLRLVPGGYRY